MNGRADQADVNDEGDAVFRARLTSEEWSDLQRRGRQHIVRTDEVLYSEGDTTKDVAVINRGWAKVITRDVGGHTSLLAVRGPGDVVGEMACLGRMPRSAEVHALGELEVLRFTHHDFVTLLREQPGIPIVLLGVLASRLRHADQWRARCGSWSVEQRLTTLLIELMDIYLPKADSNGSVSLPFSQEELGGFIGGSRKSVSRALYDLRRDGVVQTDRRNLRVLTPAELRRRAGQLPT